VLLHDDDFTTMEFVVGILETIFGHAHEVASRIMLDVHEKGIGLAGVYPHEVAEAKAAEVIRRARAAEFPFLATIEPEADEK
jgi:ATP-dependent Clp protease adaptor protein ClpS